MTKSHLSLTHSNIGREGAFLPLLVPLLNPGVGANSSEVLVEELARLILLTLQWKSLPASPVAIFNDSLTWFWLQFPDKTLAF